MCLLLKRATKSKERGNRCPFRERPHLMNEAISFASRSRSPKIPKGYKEVETKNDANARRKESA